MDNDYSGSGYDNGNTCMGDDGGPSCGVDDKDDKIEELAEPEPTRMNPNEIMLRDINRKVDALLRIVQRLDNSSTRAVHAGSERDDSRQGKLFDDRSKAVPQRARTGEFGKQPGENTYIVQPGGGLIASPCPIVWSDDRVLIDRWGCRVPRNSQTKVQAGMEVVVQTKSGKTWLVTLEVCHKNGEFFSDWTYTSTDPNCPAPGPVQGAPVSQYPERRSFAANRSSQIRRVAPVADDSPPDAELEDDNVPY